MELRTLGHFAMDRKRKLEAENLQIVKRKKTKSQEVMKEEETHIFTIDKPHTDFILPYLPSHEVVFKDTQSATKITIEKKVLIAVFPNADHKRLKFIEDLTSKNIDSKIDNKEKKNLTILEEVKEKNSYQTLKNIDDRALLYLCEGWNVKNVSDKLRIPFRKIKYSKHKIMNNKPITSVESLKITKPMEEEIEKFLSDTNNCFSSIADVREHLAQRFHLTPKFASIETIRRSMRSLGFRYKRTQNRLEERNSHRTLELRKKKVEILIDYLIAKKTPIFIDEVGFSLSKFPLYGYAKKGESVKFVGKTKGKNFSVIAAVISKKFLGFQFLKGVSVPMNLEPF